MVITFDIRPEDDIEGNTDIWVDGRRLQLYHYVSFSTIYIFMSLILFIQK